VKEGGGGEGGGEGGDSSHTLSSPVYRQAAGESLASSRFSVSGCEEILIAQEETH